MSYDAENTDTLQSDEQQLLAYLDDGLIPCANCDTYIHVDDSCRWVNRLVCEECFEEYEGLSPDDEDNYDTVYEDEYDG